MIPLPGRVEGRRRDTRLRFEQWARNPTCQANTISAVHGTPMAQAVTREGGTPTMGQSPFALARGETFERGMFRSDATALRKALADAGVEVTLEISVRVPDGVPEKVVRTVTENARTLKFAIQGFEGE